MKSQTHAEQAPLPIAGDAVAAEQSVVHEAKPGHLVTVAVVILPACCVTNWLMFESPTYGGPFAPDGVYQMFAKDPLSQADTHTACEHG